MKHSYAEKQVDVDYLIEQNLELVRKIAWQIHGRARNITDIQDIIQIGYTGLIVARTKIYSSRRRELLCIRRHKD